MGGLYTLWAERGNVYLPTSLADGQTEVWSTNIQVSCLQSDFKKSILSKSENMSPDQILASLSPSPPPILPFLSFKTVYQTADIYQRNTKQKMR